MRMLRSSASKRDAVAPLERSDRAELRPKLHRLAPGERARADALVDAVLDAVLARIDVLPGAALEAVSGRGRRRRGSGGNGRGDRAETREQDDKFLHDDTPLVRLDRPSGR
jgi:hypothetical protein